MAKIKNKSEKEKQMYKLFEKKMTFFNEYEKLQEHVENEMEINLHFP